MVIFVKVFYCNAGWFFVCYFVERYNIVGVMYIICVHDYFPAVLHHVSIGTPNIRFVFMEIRLIRWF